MKLKIEKTSSFQIENGQGGYCATVYSRRDAKLVASLARQVPNLKCLKQHATGKQPKGYYVYKGKFPLVETYDKRLDRLVRQHIREIRGD